MTANQESIAPIRRDGLNIESFNTSRRSSKLDPQNLPTIIRRASRMDLEPSIPRMMRRASQNLSKLMTNVFSGSKHEWSYEGECGPQTWDKKFTSARGKYQSPINVDTSAAEYDQTLALNPLVIDYDHHSCALIKNTGHTFQVDSYSTNMSTVSGGPTNYEFNFLQFHMHWGDTIEKGSEHLIDGKAYAAELHFVNWNHDLYKSPKVASSSNKNDGLLVLGVLIKVGKYNEEFEKLFDPLEDIQLKNEQLPVQNVHMLKLMPDNIQDYWTYPGSLTTPPCSECVTWVLFKNPVEISKDQLEKCRSLYSVSKEKDACDDTIIKYNDRPVCSLGDRVVRKSFKD